MSTYGDQPPHDPSGQGPSGPPPPPPPPPAWTGGQPTGQPTGQPAPYPGQQAPYGSPPAPYGGGPGWGAPALPYAHWVKRVAAVVIDQVLAYLVLIVAGIGAVIAFSGIESTTDEFGNVTTTGDVNPVGLVLMAIGFLAYLGFIIWNLFVKQGRTGYTIGKGLLGIKLVREADGQPIGAGMAFVRQICHVLDGFCLIGYLWPLWDAKRQTFADKIITTVVLDIPKS